MNHTALLYGHRFPCLSSAGRSGLADHLTHVPSVVWGATRLPSSMDVPSCTPPALTFAVAFPQFCCVSALRWSCCWRMELYPNGCTVAFLGFVFCIFSASSPLENTTAHLGSHLLGSSGRPCFSWADSSAEAGGCMVGQVAM